MNTEQERADFEAACDLNNISLTRQPDGTYFPNPAQHRWEGWYMKAALQSQDRDVVPYRCVAQAAHGLLGSAQYERLMEAIDHARRIEGES